jgi:hypothetical protein
MIKDVTLEPKSVGAYRTGAMTGDMVSKNLWVGLRCMGGKQLTPDTAYEFTEKPWLVLQLEPEKSLAFCATRVRALASAGLHAAKAKKLKEVE